MNGQSRNCGKIIPSIRDFVDRELPQERFNEIELHVVQCHECMARVTAERELKLVIREHVSPGPAPAGLAASIHRRIRKEVKQEKHSAAFSRRKRLLVLATSLGLVILSLGLGVWVLRQPRQNQEDSATSSRLVAELVDDHIRYLRVEKRAEYLPSDRKDAEAWFAKRLDVSVVLPPFEEQNFHLQEVRLCYVLDRRVALLFYQWDEQSLSLFAMNAAGLNFVGMDPVDLDHAQCATQTYKGYRLVSWKKNGLLYALVADQRQNGLVDVIVKTYSK